MKAMLLGIDLLVSLVIVGSALLMSFALFVFSQNSFQNAVSLQIRKLDLNDYAQQTELAIGDADITAFNSTYNITFYKYSSAKNQDYGYSYRILTLDGTEYYALLR